MSDTYYQPGIYRDTDGDIIQVDSRGIPEIIAYGTPGNPGGNYIDMSRTTKIADLVAPPTEPPAEPTLEDGVYRAPDDGEVVLVEGGKVVEVLATGDSCSTESHLPYYQGHPDLSVLVRLVVPEDDSDTLPTDGFYADKDGDLVQVRDGQMRYLDSGDVDDLDAWFDLAQEYANFAPYTPLVEAAAK